MRLTLRRTIAATAAVIAAGATLAAPSPALARDVPGDPQPLVEITHKGPGTMRHEVRHDVSPRLSSLAPVRPGNGEEEGERIRRMPNDGDGSRPDPVVQRRAGVAVAPL